MTDLTTARSDLLAAQVAHQAAGSDFCKAIEAWLKAKVRSHYPNAATIVMEGEPGEEYTTQYRVVRVLAADGSCIAGSAELEELDDNGDGPINWSEYTDTIPEMEGPDGYIGETEIDMTVPMRDCRGCDGTGALPGGWCGTCYGSGREIDLSDARESLLSIERDLTR